MACGVMLPEEGEQEKYVGVQIIGTKDFHLIPDQHPRGVYQRQHSTMHWSISRNVCFYCKPNLRLLPASPMKRPYYFLHRLLTSSGRNRNLGHHRSRSSKVNCPKTSSARSERLAPRRPRSPHRRPQSKPESGSYIRMVHERIRGFLTHLAHAQARD